MASDGEDGTEEVSTRNKEKLMIAKGKVMEMEEIQSASKFPERNAETWKNKFAKMFLQRNAQLL